MVAEVTSPRTSQPPAVPPHPHPSESTASLPKGLRAGPSERNAYALPAALLCAGVDHSSGEGLDLWRGCRDSGLERPSCRPVYA
eukprot:scaffold114389_cov32-Tisochrysis_lutea.AAC.1